MPSTTHRQTQSTQVTTYQPPIADSIVGNITRYTNICEEQSAFFRQHTTEFMHEYSLYLQSADVAQPGQNWKPAPCDRDAYVAEMELPNGASNYG